jgi:replicative DNA helicase
VARDVLDKGLPAALNEERFVISAILVNESLMDSVGVNLKPEHFCLEKHQRIYRHIVELKAAGESVDRVILANSLMRRNELEAVGGLAYLISLDEGMPKVANVDGYVRIIRDKADLRSLIATAQVLMNSALVGADSPESIAQAAANNVSRISAAMVTAKTSFTFAETVTEAGGLESFLAPRKSGIPTGFARLDQIIYGLEPKLLYVIGADSSHGKSSLVGNIAINNVFGETGTEWPHDPSPVGIFSLEMDEKAIFTRMLCSRAKVSSWKLKKGFLQPEERRHLNFAAGELAGAPLYIDATSGLSISDFCKRVRRMKQQHGIKVAFLDYLQMLNWRDDSIKTEYEGIKYSCYALQQLAKDEDIAVVALSQFHQEYSRRKDKSQRPTVDSLLGGGSIKQHADVVVLLYRRSQQFPAVVEEKNRYEFLVAKQRDGRTGLVMADFKGSWTTFVEAPDEVQPEKEGD